MLRGLVQPACHYGTLVSRLRGGPTATALRLVRFVRLTRESVVIRHDGGKIGCEGGSADAQLRANSRGVRWSVALRDAGRLGPAAVLVPGADSDLCTCRRARWTLVLQPGADCSRCLGGPDGRDRRVSDPELDHRNIPLFEPA